MYDFLIRYLGFKTDKNAAKYITCLFSAAAFACSIIFSINVFSALLMAVLDYIFCIYLLNGESFEKFFISTFIIVLENIISAFSSLLYLCIQRYFAFSLLPAIEITIILVLEAILFCITRLVIYLRRNASLSFQEILILVLIPIFSVTSVAILLSVMLEDMTIHTPILAAVLIIIGMNVLLYYLFIHIGYTYQLKENLTLIKLQYDTAAKNNNEIRHLYDEVQSVRHDMKNHFTCINHFAVQGKCDKIIEYTNEFLEEHAIKEHLFIFTGNDVLDAILNTKLSYFKREGIDCTISILLSEFPISDNDISVLMGNLLDNAYEAVKTADEKRINIKLTRHGEYMSIHVHNTVKDSVLAINPKLKTTKNDKEMHGYGTGNIRKIVNQYNGILQYHEKDNLFICDILIPMT
jgi:hypothetical protein